MRIDCRYDKGLGNAAMYVRVRSLDSYWNFTTLSWDSAETTATKAFLTEYADTGDATQSYFAVAVDVPSTSSSFEIVLASSGATLFRGTTTADPTAATLARHIANKAGFSLADTDNVRWTEAEILGWINAGQKAVVLLKPSASIATVVIPLAAGAKQTVPAGYHAVVRVVRNMAPSAAAATAVTQRLDCRYTAGLGNAALYVRIRKLGTYWNFTTKAWVAAEATATKAFLTEYDDTGDATQSYYAVDVTLPADGPYAFEIVRVSTGLTIFHGETDAGTPSTATPSVPGPAVQVVDRAVLDTVLPDWHTTAYAANVVKLVVFDAKNQTTFYVWPPQPASPTYGLEAELAAPPARIDTLDTELSLPPIYETILLDYVLYRAFSKDSTSVPNLARAAAHYQAFEQALGVRAQVEKVYAPDRELGDPA